MLETARALLANPVVAKSVGLVVAIAIVIALARLVRRAIEKRVEEATARYRLRRVTSTLAYFLVIVLVLVTFSEKLAGFTVALGVAGAGIAFALQEVIASAAGWIAISVGRFYAPGDRVQVGGITGDVIDIGILRTTLMEVGAWVSSDLYNGRIVRVANSSVFKDPVFNYSADFRFLWDEIVLPIRYGSDWEYARKVLTDVVDEICGQYADESREDWARARERYRLEDQDIAPMVTLAGTDNWIEFTTRYIVSYRQRRRVKDRLFTRILEEIDKSGGRIRLASTTMEITNVPALDVTLPGGKASVGWRYVR